MLVFSFLVMFLFGFGVREILTLQNEMEVQQLFFGSICEALVLILF